MFLPPLQIFCAQYKVFSQSQRSDKNCAQISVQSHGDSLGLGQCHRTWAYLVNVKYVSDMGTSCLFENICPGLAKGTLLDHSTWRG